MTTLARIALQVEHPCAEANPQAICCVLSPPTPPYPHAPTCSVPPCSGAVAMDARPMPRLLLL